MRRNCGLPDFSNSAARFFENGEALLGSPGFETHRFGGAITSFALGSFRQICHTFLSAALTLVSLENFRFDLFQALVLAKPLDFRLLALAV